MYVYKGSKKNINEIIKEKILFNSIVIFILVNLFLVIKNIDNFKIIKVIFKLMIVSIDFLIVIWIELKIEFFCNISFFIRFIVIDVAIIEDIILINKFNIEEMEIFIWNIANNDIEKLNEIIIVKVAMIFGILYYIEIIIAINNKIILDVKNIEL